MICVGLPLMGLCPGRNILHVDGLSEGQTRLGRAGLCVLQYNPSFGSSTRVEAQGRVRYFIPITPGETDDFGRLKTAEHLGVKKSIGQEP